MLVFEIGNNIKLEMYTPFDAEELFNVVEKNRDYLREWLPWVDSTKEVNDIRAFLEKSIKSYSEKKRIGYLIKIDNKIVGILDAFLHNESTETYQIGYWISKIESSKGIMTKSVKILIELVFKILNAKKIEIYCATTNIPSNKISQKLGFKLEGTIRNAEKVNNKIYDLNLYGLMRE
jgi:ribosomal-protein-serine acetyltransferase